jgi:hypothetical protein
MPCLLNARNSPDASDKDILEHYAQNQDNSVLLRIKTGQLFFCQVRKQALTRGVRLA